MVQEVCIKPKLIVLLFFILFSTPQNQKASTSNIGAPSKRKRIRPTPFSSEIPSQFSDGMKTPPTLFSDSEDEVSMMDASDPSTPQPMTSLPKNTKPPCTIYGSFFKPGMTEFVEDDFKIEVSTIS